MKKRGLKGFIKIIIYGVVSILLFLAGAFSSFFYFKETVEREASKDIEIAKENRAEDTGKYALSTKAEDIVRVYLESYNAELNHFFMDRHGTVYIDTSQEFVKNFQGSLLDEYLTISSLLKSLNAHMPSVKAMKLLIDGREIDTLGGHINLKDPIEMKMIKENILIK